MNEILCDNRKVILDNDGFLVNREDWNEDVAMAIARREGFDNLGREQLEIIGFMRDYYNKFQAFPILSYVCKSLHEPRRCVNQEFIDPMKAWKIAGLPRLDGIHSVTVDGKHYLLEECC